MRILMTCAEVAPLGQHGPAAEAVAALAKTLARLDHEVTVALPRHRSVTDSGLMLARRLKPIKLEVGEELHKAVLYDARLAPGVELVLLDVGDKFDRDGVYEEDGTPYEDNAERYGLFCRAVEQVVQKRKSEGRPFDVVHAHDWSTALVPYLLRAAGTKGAGTEDEGGAEGEEKPRTVLTIHNGS